MKKSHLIYSNILLFLLCSLSIFGQNSDKIKVYFDSKNYYEKSVGHYTELAFSFVAQSLKYKYSDARNALQAKVAMRYVIVNDKNDTIIRDAYLLESPWMRDSTIEDFVELKRYAIPPGKHILKLSVEDINNEKSAISGNLVIDVPKVDNKMAISSITVAESIFKDESNSLFFKHGFSVIPRFYNYFGKNDNKIPLFFEVYRMDTTENYGLKQTLISIESNDEIEQFTKFSKLDRAFVNPYIKVIDITKLKEGKYRLKFDVLDKNSEVLASQFYEFDNYKEEEFVLTSTENIILDPIFQESVSDDSLAFYIESLIPISKPAETKNIIKLLKEPNNEVYRKYLQSYWTNTSPKNTTTAWLNYKKQVLIVQSLFKTNFMDGFETDRGRVYLQYGPPNNVITRETSPTEYPYEIWRYDKIQQFSNKRFVFYNPDLVNNTYRLLHSDMRGELQNYRWQQQLSKRNSFNSDIDNGNDGNFKHYGGNSEELYNQY